MTPDDLKRVLVEALRRVAPEADPAAIDSRVSLREQLDLDSMDFLNFVTALHTRLSIDIPEIDYPRLSNLDDAVAYLASKTGAGAASAPTAGVSPSGGRS